MNLNTLHNTVILNNGNNSGNHLKNIRILKNVV